MTTATRVAWLPDALAHAEAKVARLAQRLHASYPHATLDGRYLPEPADWWTSGFYPGLLWLVYRNTGNEALADLAVELEDGLERLVLDKRLYDLHHDVGFQFQPSAVMRYKLTGHPDGRRRGVLAAMLLMSRYNPNSGVIEAWNDRKFDQSIVDTLMNLPLLFWATEETGLLRYRNVALKHLERAVPEWVRADGTTYHVLRFDPKTGERTEAIGGQGYAPESCWSRGQSWAVYGLALAHRYTKHPLFLEKAKLVSDSFIRQLPASKVPPWDFRAPNADSAPRDSSAGAIAASGLLELADLLPESEGAPYREAALDILEGLNTHCATWNRDDQDGLLMHATGKKPRDINVDVSLIYGDYYFLEALYRLQGQRETCW